MQIRGSIYGGQQPVSGSSIHLYAAGKTGDASPATSILITPVSSDSNGLFSLTADYTCLDVEDQVYLTAQGGNPGLITGTDNAALTLMVALGRCGDLHNVPFLNVNELTTVAAAWALAPFMTSATNVGTTPTNAAGIRNAFLNTKLLVDPQSGMVPTLPSNLSVESGKVIALANSIASCVNSDGGSGCTPLFSAATPQGGTAPTDTLKAALNVVKNPANNVTDVFNAASPFPPFISPLTTPPNEWTMSMTVTGGGISSPTALAVDAAGNVWATGYFGVLSAYSPQGAPLSGAGYGLGKLYEGFGMTIDTSGDIWATIEEFPSHSPTRGSVAKFGGSSSGNQGAYIAAYADISLDYPVALTADTNGNVIVANYANSSATIYNSGGGMLLGLAGSGSSSFPVAVAADVSHGFWLANLGDFTVAHIAADGTVLAHPSCCNGANGIAVDRFGNAWVANYYGSSVSEVANDGTTTINNLQGGGVTYPSGIAIDGAQDVWVTNYRGASISHLAGNGSTAPAGTPYSPDAGLGLDASLALPFAIATDPSGNVWVSNYANDDIVMFFGLAVPTKTPVTPTPSHP